MLEAASVAGQAFVVASVAAGLERAEAAVEAVCEGLARRGHQVTLWEQSHVPGGVLRQVAGMPAVHLRDLASYGDYVLRALAHDGGLGAFEDITVVVSPGR